MSACDGLITRGPNKGKPARGTTAGANRHRDAGEDLCDECQAWWLAYSRAWWDKKREQVDNERGGRRRAGTQDGGEWCKALKHLMTPANVRIQSNGRRACRACMNSWSRRSKRRSVECVACNRWMTPEAYDLHQAASPGNPNAPLECLSDEELMKRHFRVVRRPNSDEVPESWEVRLPKSHCPAGHKFTNMNTYTDPDGGRHCIECRKAANRRSLKRAVERNPERIPVNPRTHCPAGHELTEENTHREPGGYQRCRICVNARASRYRARHRELNPLPPRATHCKRGHEFTEENTIIRQGRRSCRICKADLQRRRQALKREERGLMPVDTHCFNGHKRTKENTYINPTTGWRYCRICQSASSGRWYARKKARKESTPGDEKPK